MSRISVGLITWPKSPERIGYFVRTLAALRAGILDPPETISYFASAESEGIDEATRCRFEQACDHADVELYWHHPPASIGANWNNVVDRNRSPFLFMVQDDWLLTRPVLLANLADFLDAHTRFGMVRLSWSPFPGHTFTIADQPSFWPTGTMDLFEIDPNSVYLYADEPHLRRGNRELPAYLEGGNMGTAELSLNGAMKDYRWRVAIPAERHFEHFGGESTRPDHTTMTAPVTEAGK